MSDEEEDSLSEGFSASEDEWKPTKNTRGGESSDDDDSDFEDVPGATGSAGGGVSNSGNRKREPKAHPGAKGVASAKKRKPTGQSLRTKLFNKYRPPPRTLQSPTTNSPSASTSRNAASKNAKGPNESGEQEDKDDSSSDSSVENYLVNPQELDLRSSFFDVGAGGSTKKPTKSPVPFFDCNAGVNLSDSGSEDNNESSQDDEQRDEKQTTTVFDFRHLIEKTNDLERAKADIALRAEQATTKGNTTAHMDVNSLLALGENNSKANQETAEQPDPVELGPSRLSKTKSTRIKRHTKTRPTSTVLAGDTDDSDWEEVADESSQNDHSSDFNPTTGDLEIHIEHPGKKSRQKKEDEELMTAFRRKLNRDLREQQLLMHKASLLCCFARAHYYNKLLNDSELMQASLKLLPSANAYPPEQGTELKYFQSMVTWFKTAVKLTSPNLYPDKTPKGRAGVKRLFLEQIHKKEARCKQDMIFIFIMLLRGMGLQCRLVVNMQPLPMKPKQEDLVPVNIVKKDDKKQESEKAQPKSAEKKVAPPKANAHTSGKATETKQRNATKKDTSVEGDTEAPRQATSTRTPRSKPVESHKVNKPTEADRVVSDHEASGRSCKRLPATKKPEKVTPTIIDHREVSGKFCERKDPAKKAETAGKETRQAKSVRSSARRDLKVETEMDHEVSGRTCPLPDRDVKELIKEIKIHHEVSGEFCPRKSPKVATDEIEHEVSGEFCERKSAEKSTKKAIKRRNGPPVADKAVEIEEKNLLIANSASASPTAPPNDAPSSQNVVRRNQRPALTRLKRAQTAAATDAKKNKSAESENSENLVEPITNGSSKRSSPKEPVLTVAIANNNPDILEVPGKPERDMRSRSRSISPKIFVSTEFLKSESHKAKFPPDPPKPEVRKPKTKSPTIVKVNPEFLHNPKIVVVQPEENEPPRRNLRKRKNVDALAVPQLDGADDIVPTTSKRPRLKNLQKSRSKETSDDDFEPSPPKKAKPAPKVIEKLRRDQRVLSTDEDETAASSNKTKPTANDMWVEAWSEAEEQWICIDIFKVKLHSVEWIKKAASSSFAYIFAFQNDLSIKDVSARYCTNWSTTLRKLRVDNDWLKTALRRHVGRRTKRDIREDQELRRIHEEKPMPTAIGDYKDHPFYALERHLLKFQAIYPPNAPTLGFIRKEPVYARECVHTLHSREIWLKSARVVKLGEQPYKIVKARPKWDRHTQTVIKDQPLEIFGYWQTQEYDPPTAENGIVPRNAYGNVELFKACMLPKKTVHLRLNGLQRICKKLNIDCANAVVGFDFHQGACHPMYDGFIVCEEFAEVVTAAWEEDQREQERKEQEKYEARVYGNWKKLIRGLQIREKLKLKYKF